MSTAENLRIPTWTVGDRLRKARESVEFEQAELAEAIGVSRATVSNYEGGRVAPRKIMLNAWALATGVPVEWLRSGVVPSNPDDDERARRDSNSQPSDPKIGVSGHTDNIITLRNTRPLKSAA